MFVPLRRSFPHTAGWPPSMKNWCPKGLYPRNTQKSAAGQYRWYRRAVPYVPDQQSFSWNRTRGKTVKILATQASHERSLYCLCCSVHCEECPVHHGEWYTSYLPIICADSWDRIKTSLPPCMFSSGVFLPSVEWVYGGESHLSGLVVVGNTTYLYRSSI
jgi:hypothetical protein